MANNTMKIQVAYFRTESVDNRLVYGVPEDYTLDSVIDFLDGLVAEGWTSSGKDDDRSKITVYVEINADVHIRPDEVLPRRGQVQRFYHPPEGMELRGVADSIEAGPFKRIDGNQWPFNECENS